jgi:pimeloyl-ACP methyl ester carboxylesterase
VLAFGHTDFHSDVQAVTVPTLIIHGNADKIVPIEGSSNKLAQMLPQAQYNVYEGAPHGLFYTHREQLNADLVRFCTAGSGESAPAAIPTIPMGKI